MRSMRWTALLIVVVAVGALSSPTELDASRRDKGQLLITRATADLEQELLTIIGKNFGDGPPVVALAGEPLEVVYASPVEILAKLSPEIVAGDYLLTVSRAKRPWKKGGMPHTRTTDSFALTIGAVGAQGPAGEPGEKGDPGEPGIPGPPGVVGTLGDLQGLPCELDGQPGSVEMSFDAEVAILRCVLPVPTPTPTPEPPALGPGIHLELTWHTPADPDETDNEGSDLDLHLRHPQGSWATPPWDCYSFNPNPDWGAPYDPADDPLLLADDDDGAGPEILTLERPEPGLSYRVGLHYSDDNGWGASYATVRVFVDQVLRYEATGIGLQGTGYFAEVADIEWPSGTVTPIEPISVTPWIP